MGLSGRSRRRGRRAPRREAYRIGGLGPPAGSAYDAPVAALGVVACGALALHLEEIVARRGLDVALRPLPPLLHNRPAGIAAAVEEAATALAGRHARVAVAYADCGTYGALDEVCGRLGLARLPGRDCYDVFAGAERMRAMYEDEPGTYVLTDFLVRGFERLVVRELGLDRHPELRDDYFRHYRRVVWIAQRRTPELAALAEAAAVRLGLPLEVVPVGDAGLEEALLRLLDG